MTDLKPGTPTEGTSVTYVGVSNCSIKEQRDSALTYSSMSYTVGVVSEAADHQPQSAPSRPLNRDGVRTLDSVLRSGGHEANILRDKSGEL